MAIEIRNDPNINQIWRAWIVSRWWIVKWQGILHFQKRKKKGDVFKKLVRTKKKKNTFKVGQTGTYLETGKELMENK